MHDLQSFASNIRFTDFVVCWVIMHGHWNNTDRIQGSPIVRFVPYHARPNRDRRCVSADIIGGANWLETYCPFVYKCLHGAAPSYHRDPVQSADFSARRRLRSESSSSLVVRRIRDCQPSATELSRRRRSCLERSTTARNIRTVSVHIPQSSEDSPLPAEQWLCHFRTR